MDTQTVTQVAPEMVAEAKKKSMGMKRPKKLVKGSAAAKRWMAYVRSQKKGAKRSSAKTPVRKTAGKRSVKKTTKKGPGRPRKTSGKKSTKKSASKKGRK